MKYIISNSSITFFHNGRPINIQKGSAKYAKILKAFDLPESKQDEAIENILNESKVFAEEAKKEGFEFKGDQVFIDGELLPQVLVDKINSLRKEGLPITLFLNFWRNLKENPDFVVVNDRGLYDFLSYRELPLTEDGYLIAYRGVKKDYWSISGNPNTKVISGKTNQAGQIFNGIGEVIEIVRNQVTTDRSVHCHHNSLHIGSLDYAKNWGNKVVVVKINPKDVVSVASDCGCQKLRVCKFEVLSDLAEEILSPATTARGEEIIDKVSIDLDKFQERISNYLIKKSGHGYVSVKQIQNIFSPEYPDKKRVLAAISELGYYWFISEEDGKEWVEV